MSKLNMHTPDLTAANVAKIASLFPNCVTESRDDKGNLRTSVDFDLLRQELNGDIVEGPVERYTLNWPGKRESIVAANTPVYKTLRPCVEESVNFDTTQNIYIEGDNLEVLKLLQETYLGKVKMIYIDPPYNTGNDFIYDDNFAESVETDLLKSSQKDESGGRLVSNKESNGRYHSDWLSMIYPRLKLACDLLCEDGVIFISIDDNEVHNLRKICDEIFGADNFVSTAIVVRSKNGLGSHEGFATNHDYLLVYQRHRSDNTFCYLRHTDEYLKKFDKEDSYGRYKIDGILRKKGDGQRREDSPGCYYPIFYDDHGNAYLEEKPGLSVAYPKLPNGGDGRWVWSKSFASDKLHRIYVSKGGTVYLKDYLKDATRIKPRTVLDHKSYITEVATEEIQSLFNDKIFDTPKPLSLIIDLIDHGCGENDVVLDFFSGSATTAHAVMQLNVEDGGNRRFIMVQLPEVCEENSEASKAGFKNICEIGKERIRRASKKIKEENATNAPNLDVGFRVFKVDSSNMKDVYYTPDALEQSKLDLFADAIKEDRTAEDLLFQIFLDCGLDLSLPVAKEKVEGHVVYVIDGNAMVACFTSDVSEPLIRALAKRQPIRAVFLDRSFGKDSTKLNVTQIFKQLSPNTDVKTI